MTKCSGCDLEVEIVDKYMPKQDPNSLDPAVEVLLCQECVNIDIAFWKSFGYMPLHKVRAAYEEQLAKDMGFTWKEKGMDDYGIWVQNWKLKEKKKK